MLEVVAMLAAIAKAVPILASLCNRLAGIITEARAENRQSRKDKESDDAIDALAAQPRRKLNPRTGRVE